MLSSSLDDFLPKFLRLPIQLCTTTHCKILRRLGRVVSLEVELRAGFVYAQELEVMGMMYVVLGVVQLKVQL